MSIVSPSTTFKTVAVTATGSAAAVGDAIRTVATIDALET
jgi:hypothetical protein